MSKVNEETKFKDAYIAIKVIERDIFHGSAFIGENSYRSKIIEFCKKVAEAKNDPNFFELQVLLSEEEIDTLVKKYPLWKKRLFERQA